MSKVTTKKEEKVAEKKMTDTEKIQQQLEELEKQKKAAQEEVLKIKQETDKAAQNLKQAREDHSKVQKELDEKSSKVNDAVKDLTDSGNLDALNNYELTDRAFEEPVKDDLPKEESPQKKARPQTPATPADYDKKEKQKPRFLKVQDKIETKKSEAAA